MLLLLGAFLLRTVVPLLGAYAKVFITYGMTVFIVIMGLIMAFGALGMRISSGLGSTIMGNFGKALGKSFQLIVAFITWLVKAISEFARWTYKTSNSLLESTTLAESLRQLIAGLITFVVILLII